MALTRVVTIYASAANVHYGPMREHIVYLWKEFFEHVVVDVQSGLEEQRRDEDRLRRHEAEIRQGSECYSRTRKRCASMPITCSRPWFMGISEAPSL